MSSVENILLTISFLKKELCIPRINEVLEFNSEETTKEQFLTDIKELVKNSKVMIEGDYIIDEFEQALGLITDNRNRIEVELRNFIKTAQGLKILKGVSGLFISILDQRPLIIVIGDESNSKFITKRIQKSLKLFKNSYSIQYITNENQIIYNDRMFFSIIKATPIVDNDRIYSTILGLYFNRLGGRFPNLPIDILKGVRISKTAKFECVIPKYQKILNTIYTKFSL